ncbi:helix-turn-helix domain-containing protein [Enterococcus faecalis]|uniref:helix-turn-helix domain-containing protein n=1 Tax=Enterococcus faecalis TaxID=1351 RepID=UPI00032F2FD9|nr:S24 family peptidase [Enterococcus faecalis]EGO7725478.1 helix-turn-helix domain-containing protein [Enterococcus faecalis]EGO8644188.1 helix-turn-helix domain-containing protein [Enterococcus faecalis]EGS8308131.1 helix-turn-helix domain-containing protein [Enterococcus faecalis]EJG4466686.1 helix-turn-helix domain-containing protein [Enterococcus faecalis]EJI7180129.1 helix-turn-helix domain-containing protein [Enterococcus faecalis]
MNTKDIVVGKMIRYFLTQEKMTMKELGNKLGKTESTVSKWVSGASTPMAKDLSTMTFIFNTDINTLMYGGEQSTSTILSLITETSTKLEPPRQEKVYVFAKNQLEEQDKENSRNKNITSLEQYKERKQQKKSMATIDWCGAVSAGTGEFLVDEYREQIALPTEIIPDDADFCLTVNGDSMEPIFHNNDYVFIKKQLEIYSGAIGVVVVNGAAFLKRVWFENNHARLQSFNSNYKDIIVTDADDFRIIGKVVM